MIKAVIFDMDGVISNTMGMHTGIESDLLAQYGVAITPEEIARRFAGAKTELMFRRLLKEYGNDADPMMLLGRKKELMMTAIERHVAPIPGALELIRELSTQQFPIAVASGSSLEMIHAILGSLDVLDLFPIRTSCCEVKEGKPAPDVFLLAASRLGFHPEQCLVIEDSMNGMVAAKKAGMKVIGLVPEKLPEYPADVLVNSLVDVNLQFIKRM